MAMSLAADRRGISLAGQLHKVAALEQDSPGDAGRRLGYQAQDRERGQRLARAALADDADGFRSVRLGDESAVLPLLWSGARTRLSRRATAPGHHVRRLSSSSSSTLSPRPGAVGSWKRPSRGRGGFEKTACMRGDGSFNSGLGRVQLRARGAGSPCGRSSAASGAARARRRARGPARRSAAAGDAAHLDDVRLHHAHPGHDQVGQRRQGVGLLAGGDGDVEPPRDLAHRPDMVVLHRLLEPPVAELLEHPPDADRAAGRVAVIGVEGERKIVADQLAHRARLGDVARDIAVEPCGRCRSGS